METKTKLLLALGGVTVLVITGYLTRDKWMPKKLPVAKKATPAQFDKFVKMTKDNGSDMFEGATTEQLKDFMDKYTKNLTSAEAEHLTSIVSKKESLWAPSEKIDFIALLKKVTGKVAKG